MARNQVHEDRAVKFKHTFTLEQKQAMKRLKSEYRRDLITFQQFHNDLLNFYT